MARLVALDRFMVTASGSFDGSSLDRWLDGPAPPISSVDGEVRQRRTAGRATVRPRKGNDPVLGLAGAQLAELHLEAFLPADDHTADVMRRRWG
jgi:hypothetical protein